jgi:SurA N-terminal domain
MPRSRAAADGAATHGTAGPGLRHGNGRVPLRGPRGAVWQPRGVHIRRLTAVAVAGIALVGLAGCRTSPNVAAYVGDSQVSVSELEAAIDARLEDPAIAEFAETQGADYTRRVLSGLVEAEVHEAAAERYGVEVSDDEVRDRISELLGDDDPAEVYGQLAEQGVSREDVFASVEQQLVRLRIAESEGVSDALSQEALRARYEETREDLAEIEFGYITVPDDATAQEVVEQLTADPSTYPALAEQYAGTYTLPEIEARAPEEIPGVLADQATAAEPGTAFAVPVEETGGVVVSYVGEQTYPSFAELRPQLEQEAAAEADQAALALVDEVRQDLDVVVNPQYGSFEDGSIQPSTSSVVEILGAEG